VGHLDPGDQQCFPACVGSLLEQCCTVTKPLRFAYEQAEVDQNAIVEWLDEMQIEASLSRVLLVRRTTVTCYRDEQRIDREACIPQHTGGYIAIQFRHGDVEEDDLRSEGARAGQSFATVVGDLDGVPGNTQQNPRAFSGIDMVVYDQHACAGRCHVLALPKA